MCVFCVFTPAVFAAALSGSHWSSLSPPLPRIPIFPVELRPGVFCLQHIGRFEGGAEGLAGFLGADQPLRGGSRALPGRDEIPNGVSEGRELAG